MKPIPKLLSKTRIMRAYQCPKSLYLNIHFNELEPKVSEEQQAIFDQGHEVGKEAHKYFPNGVLVEAQNWEFGAALSKTRELLAQGHPVIFEAAFEHKGYYARTDVIQFNPHSNRWNIYEVKSATKLKDEYIEDVALQAWIIANSGLKIETINIMHLNPACRFPDLKNLYITEDVTEKMREKYLQIRPRLDQIDKTIRTDKIPDVDIGPHCSSPNPCSFKPVCWKEKQIPEMSIFNLPKIYERQWDLYQQNILHLDDPRLMNLDELQSRVVEVYKSGKRFLDKERMQKEISSWKFPMVFLDFETINPAIPRYAGTGPYQQVPFQFSVHVWEKPDAELVHHEYLHADASDPRPELIPALLKACQGEGSIVAYYAKFETDRIKEMAEAFPQHKDELLSLVPRMVDPFPILRASVYDNAFEGSFSLKKVGPALLGDLFSYKGLKVSDGLKAQREFANLISPFIKPDEKNNSYQAMLEYCRKDTFVMVELVKWMMS